MNMRSALFALACAISSLAYAGPQQDRMKACNADAAKKELAGDARKTFMKDCLAGRMDMDHMSRQDRMKACNADAAKKDVKGDARKAFMKECLGAKKEARMPMAQQDTGLPMSQQDRMKACNADAAAKALKGDAHRRFMQDCLSSH